MSVIIDGTNGISDVDGSASTPAIRGTDANTGIFFPAADTIAFAEGGAEAMRIDSSGRVGIGTTSPSALLNVSVTGAANGSTTDALILNNTNSNSGDNLGTGISWMRTGNNASYIYTRIASIRTGTHDTDLAFSVNNGGTLSERARITSGGQFLVGTTNTSGTAGNGFKVINNGETVNVVTAQSQNADRSTYEFYSTGASAYRFYVGAGGTVYATNTTISALSDQRLKENIQDIDVGLDAVMALKPRKFDWKEGKGKDIKGDRGWIAQEFEQVFPEMIDVWKDEPPEGEEPYKSVNADLIPVLTKAIQELKAINDAQATRIETLEAQNAAFEARLAALEAK
jgi:hypothetical protein